MGKYYESAEQLYEIYSYFMDKVLSDEKIGPRIAKAGIIIKFIYYEPDAEITIDLKNPPAKEGFYGTYYLGPCEIEEDVWSAQAADFSHSFWHGRENPIAAVSKGLIKQGGKVTAMLRLLPVVRPAFKMFPQVLVELGYPEKVIKD